MSWFACHRTKAADELQRKHPNAMLLFLLVARRARYEEGTCPVTGLEKGECHIGDHESAGLTRQEYRTALGVLEKLDFLTTKRTNKGTTCKISERPLSSTVFTSFNHSLQPADQPADQPASNQQPTTKKKVREKEGKERGTLEELQEFAVSLGLPATDGEFMFLKWEESGWKNSGTPVKSWKAGITKWKSQGWLPSQKTQNLFTQKDSSKYGI